MLALSGAATGAEECRISLQGRAPPELALPVGRDLQRTQIIAAHQTAEPNP